MDNISYVRSPRSGFGNYSQPKFQLPLSARGGGLRGAHKLTCSAATYLVSLGLAWAERGMDTLYKYTWSTVCCATWCNTPVPSSFCSLSKLYLCIVDFKLIYVNSYSEKSILQNGIFSSLFLKHELVSSNAKIMNLGKTFYTGVFWSFFFLEE